MALSDLVTRTRNILYGSGLGEKPAIRLGASNANESVAGQLVTFSLAAGEGDKVKKGNVLGVYDPATEADAHVIYVTSISTDAITGINSYLGSPAIVGSDSGDLDSAVFEQNPLATGFEIFEAIDAVFAHQLWPWVFDLTQGEIASPDLVDGQEAIAAGAREVVHAWQRLGGTNYPVPFEVTPWDVSTDLASTGRQATFGWIDASKGYYLYKEKLAEADDSGDELTHMVATGAAALLLGGHLVETSIQGTKADNAQAVSQRAQIGNSLWRDFLTLRQNYSEELTRLLPHQIIINRG